MNCLKTTSVMVILNAFYKNYEWKFVNAVNEAGLFNIVVFLIFHQEISGKKHNLHYKLQLNSFSH